MLQDDETSNFQIFRDCLSTTLIEVFAITPTKPTRRRKGGNGRKTPRVEVSVDPLAAQASQGENDAEELAEFIDKKAKLKAKQYLATDIFAILPAELRLLTLATYASAPSLQERYAVPLTALNAGPILQNLSPATADSLEAYGLTTASASVDSLLAPALNAYLTAVTAAPSQTRHRAAAAAACCCDICERDWVPLTQHHLIPKFVHAKVLKRGWHAADQLGNVACLCRACHSFVHSIASHEELARYCYTVDLLLQREDVARFGQWVSKVRWKTR
ncbi:MAG: hypothetical protein M1818_003072 [Claussenomyces sp. TS43310]|nr:MAG: hypothetical protein M1818_003072 [Claussenomyces sp. TS43310]